MKSRSLRLGGQKSGFLSLGVKQMINPGIVGAGPALRSNSNNLALLNGRAIRGPYEIGSSTMASREELSGEGIIRGSELQTRHNRPECRSRKYRLQSGQRERPALP